MTRRRGGAKRGGGGGTRRGVRGGACREGEHEGQSARCEAEEGDKIKGQNQLEEGQEEDDEAPVPLVEKLPALLDGGSSRPRRESAPVTFKI